MTTETWLSFFVLLTITTNLATLALWAVAGAARLGSAGAVGLRERTRVTLDSSGLALATLVAITATVGSLYLSEGAHLVPCRFCWYQRIAMYPLGVILLVATIRRDWRVKPYALTLAIGGAVIAVYHVLVEHYPSLEAGVTCDPFNPCAVNLIQGYDLAVVPFQFMQSIPYMALSGFLFVVTALLARPGSEPTADDDTWDDGRILEEAR